MSPERETERGPGAVIRVEVPGGAFGPADGRGPVRGGSAPDPAGAPGSAYAPLPTEGSPPPEAGGHPSPAESADGPGGPSGAYEVHVAPGRLASLGALCRTRLSGTRCAVLADATVAGLYGDRVLSLLEEAGFGPVLFDVPPGEASKCRREWARLTDRMLEAGLGRDAWVVALGGGVAGDLAGFVAATYMRGLPVVQLPTTLLAMVDASVGGKTGVNTPAGKNLVGAFHHPVLVVADTELLSTLPREELSAGLSEAVKVAALVDAELLAWIGERAGALLEGDPRALARLVRRCVRIKARVVREDPREAGRREILNFGHTVGHALETLSGYGLPHGRAVAAGMRVEARLGEAMGVTRPGTARRLAEVLDACGHLERPEAGVDSRRLLEAAAADKKVRGGELRVVLLREPGRVATAPGGGYAHTLEGDGAADRLRTALRPPADVPDFRPGTAGRTEGPGPVDRDAPPPRASSPGSKEHGSQPE